MHNAWPRCYEHAIKQTPQGILTLPQYDWRTGDIVDRGAFWIRSTTQFPILLQTVDDVAMVIGACLWIPEVYGMISAGFRMDGIHC